MHEASISVTPHSDTRARPSPRCFNTARVSTAPRLASLRHATRTEHRPGARRPWSPHSDHSQVPQRVECVHKSDVKPPRPALLRPPPPFRLVTLQRAAAAASTLHVRCRARNLIALPWIPPCTISQPHTLHCLVSFCSCLLLYSPF
jgi:hypothetical protein